MAAPEILRYTAFSSDPTGGNPAGVVLDAGGLDDAECSGSPRGRLRRDRLVTGMREDGARAVRTSPPSPKCRSAARHDRHGRCPGRAQATRSIVFDTPVGDIRIEIERGAGGIPRGLHERSDLRARLDPDDRDAILLLLGLSSDELDSTLPPRIADAGNPHPVIVLADRTRFDAFTFDPHRVRALMDARGWPRRSPSRPRGGGSFYRAGNLFPVGRITEDPATGSAAAALGAYLRELDAVRVPARIAIEQGPARRSPRPARRRHSGDGAHPRLRRRRADDGRLPPARYRRLMRAASASSSTRAWCTSVACA